MALGEPPQATLENSTLHLPSLLSLSRHDFHQRYRYSAIWRATVEGLARNAAVVLGNLKDSAARPCLEDATQKHPSALVREHAAWALAQLG